MRSGVRASRTVEGCSVPVASNTVGSDSWVIIDSSQLSVKMDTIVVGSPNGCLKTTHRQQVLPEAAGKEKGETHIAEGALSD